MSKSAENGLGQLRGPSWLTGTLLAAPIRPLSSRMSGVSVCKSHHSWNVMKEGQRPRPREAWPGHTDAPNTQFFTVHCLDRRWRVDRAACVDALRVGMAALSMDVNCGSIVRRLAKIANRNFCCFCVAGIGITCSAGRREAHFLKSAKSGAPPFSSLPTLRATRVGLTRLRWGPPAGGAAFATMLSALKDA